MRRTTSQDATLKRVLHTPIFDVLITLARHRRAVRDSQHRWIVLLLLFQQFENWRVPPRFELCFINECAGLIRVVDFLHGLLQR